ncbi:Hypp891 [Branchiostoma lanceolatum]|uniref:Hypp891 protein n=1 Tax=Branchiostoma lanceolatum TaxID=7740 RepID=A0A8J9VGQ9_BRALA|nr:Hypp891 [Branchiostoma lanceolatum]
MPPVTAPVMATAGSPVVEKHASCHGYGGESCSEKACLLSWLRWGVLKWKSMPPVMPPVMATAGSPVVKKHASCHGYGGES